jgi:hypothetical protein
MILIRPLVIGALCIVLPFPMYFAEGGVHPNKVCNLTPANPQVVPPNLDCEEGAGCPSRRYYYNDTGTCGGTSEADCFENPMFEYQEYVVKSTHGGYLPPELAMSLAGGAVCFAVGFAATGVAAGLVIAVLCTGVTYTLIEALDPCLFYTCEMDWLAGSTDGPIGTICN